MKRVEMYWRRPGGKKRATTLDITRKRHGNKWANRFTVAEHGRDKAIALFVEHQLPELIPDLHELDAYCDIACYCKINERCHGDELVRAYREMKR